MNKKILILEPNTTAGRFLVETAKRLKIDVVGVTTEKFYQKYDSNFRTSLDSVFFTQFYDLNKAQKDIVEFAKKNNIQGVVSGFEFFSDLAVEVASALDLSTNNITFAKVYRDKYLMAKLFEEKEVPSAKTILVTKRTELSKLKFPLIVKPSKNAGSCFVRKVCSPTELQESRKLILQNDIEFPHGFPLKSRVIVQEIMEGPEFSVELISTKGCVHVLAITDKETTCGNFFAELGHTIPSCVDVNTKKKIENIAIKAVNTLGITNGVAHVEVILTKSGPKIVEVGARLPGDYIPNILLNATGINEAELYLRVALGLPINIEKSINKFSGIRFIRTQENGVIKKIKTASKTNVDIYVNNGDYVETNESNVARLGHYINTDDCYRQVTNNLQKALLNTEVIYEKNSVN